MKLSVTCANGKLDLEVVFRKRKTMEIQVHPPGTVKVIVPAGTSKQAILTVVKSKENWLTKKLNELKDIGCLPAERELVTGASLFYLGSKYQLEVQKTSNVKVISVRLQPGKLLVVTPTKDQGKIKEALEQWYRKKAAVEISERVQYYAVGLKKAPTEIKIKHQKRRWGSCTGAGKLLFNWRCIMAPGPILDYVIVHEMCHLHYMNHSKDFWGLVGSIIPDYKERRAWLKKNGVLLDL
ncbi:MAG: M48 family metallopeptidase [Firmicutes bacterium]|nr:M48 family metallopeptidase [Bacillota bacterium]